MKLLILSSCNRWNEPETPHVMHLFLSSLFTNIVPNVDELKVIMFTGHMDKGDVKQSETWNLIVEYGLDSYIELKCLSDFDLPDNDYKYALEKFGAHGYNIDRLSIMLNLLWDYAERNDSFGMDWTVYVDTDTELLDHFIDTFNILNSINKPIVCSITGDWYPDMYYVDGKEYIFWHADKRKFYAGNPGEWDESTARNIIEVRKSRHDATEWKYIKSKLVASPEFLAANRAAYHIAYNLCWLSPVQYNVSNELSEAVSHAMPGGQHGTKALTTLMGGRENILFIQMSGGQKPIIHVGSMWHKPEKEVCGTWAHQLLEQKYDKLRHIWGKHYQ